MKQLSRGHALQADPQLRPLLRRLDELERLLERVRATLPAEVAQGCKAVCWVGNDLVIAVGSAAVAQRLRHCLPATLAELHRQQIAVNRLIPRLSSVFLPPWHPPKRLRIPEVAEDAFAELAGQVQDEGLRHAVENLVRRHGRHKVF